MAFDELRKKLSAKYGLLDVPDPNDQEDVVPYDPEAGTIMNIGRFAANNLAKGSFLAGGMPLGASAKLAAGTLRSVPKSVAKGIFNPQNEEHLAEIRPLLKKYLPHSPDMAEDMASGEVISHLLKDPERSATLMKEPMVQQAIKEAGFEMHDLEMEALKKLSGQ